MIIKKKPLRLYEKQGIFCRIAKRYGQHSQPHERDKADQQRFNIAPLYQSVSKSQWGFKERKKK